MYSLIKLFGYDNVLVYLILAKEMSLLSVGCVLFVSVITYFLLLVSIEKGVQRE